jgi:hypothetical protein
MRFADKRGFLLWILIFAMVAPLLVVLATGAASAEFVGQTYTSRQELTEATTFRDCEFSGCKAWLNDGGIYLFDESISLTISGCVFAGCEAV